MALLESNLDMDLREVWLLADLDGDMDVDGVDAQILSDNVGMSNPTRTDGDLNGDGSVNVYDLDLMYTQYGLDLEVVS